MSRFFKKIKNKILVAGTAAVSAAALAVAASAEGETGLASAAEQITSQFTSAASDITPIILGVLGAGLGIFVIFVGIKLAKKMFSTVSKG